MQVLLAPTIAVCHVLAKFVLAQVAEVFSRATAEPL